MGKRSLLFSLACCAYCFCAAQKDPIELYINTALQNSPLLKDLQNQAELNKYDSLLIRASLKPQVNGSSINSYAPVIKGFGYDAALTNGGSFTALVGVNKLMPNKKNLAAQFENLQLQQRSLANTGRISEQDLKRTIIGQYIVAFGSLQQAKFYREIGQFLAKEETVLKKLTRANVYRQTDYLAFLVTLQQQELITKQLDIQYKNDLSTLNYLCGISDTTTVMLPEPALSAKPLPGLGSSVFFRQFELDSLKLDNNKRLVDAAYRPKLNLYADAGFNSTLAFSPYKNFGTSIGASLLVPLYDGKQKQLQYNKIGVAENTRKKYQAFFFSQYRQQVSQLRAQLVATESLINDIRLQLDYIQRLIDVNGKLLEAGEVKITDYILALNNYINAKNQITQNTITRLQIINQINYWDR